MFFLILPRPPSSTLFPYTTLFRSWAIGLALALTLATILLLFRKAILTQREEIKLRKLAEDAARESAEEARSEEHTSELQSPCNLVCRLLLEKKKTRI